MVNDSSGNLLQIHIKKNRFICIAKNITATSLQFLDKNMIYFAATSTQRKVEIYNIQGNKVVSLDGHKSKVTKIECNFLKEQFFSQSKDVLILWDLKNFTKIKSFNPKSSQLVDAFFTKDAQAQTTIFNDHTVYEWNLNTFEIRLDIKFPGWSSAYSQSSFNKNYFVGYFFRNAFLIFQG